MNKNVSLAIEKAVGSISQKHQNELKNNGPKKPDLFSLSGETELFQNDKGITIKIDRSRDANLTDFGKATLTDRYLGQNESFQDLFARVASTASILACVGEGLILIKGWFVKRIVAHQIR